MTKKIMIILLMLLLLVGCKTETNNKEAKKNETKTEAKVDKKVDKKENSKYKFRDEEMVVKGFFSNVYIAFPRFDPEFDEGGSIESKGTGEVIYYHDTYILFDEAQIYDQTIMDIFNINLDEIKGPEDILVGMEDQFFNLYDDVTSIELMIDKMENFFEIEKEEFMTINGFDFVRQEGKINYYTSNKVERKFYFIAYAAIIDDRPIYFICYEAEKSDLEKGTAILDRAIQTIRMWEDGDEAW